MQQSYAFLPEVTTRRWRFPVVESGQAGTGKWRAELQAPPCSRLSAKTLPQPLANQRQWIAEPAFMQVALTPKSLYLRICR